MREFTLPDVGEGVHEGELIEWLVAEGDAVSEDQPVAKVETDKALVDVPAPVNGTVRELRWSEGDVIPVGEVLLVFDVEGEVDDAELATESEPAEQGGADSRGVSGATESPAETSGEPSGEPTAERSTESPADASDADQAADASGRVFAAPSARRLARELGVDVASVDGSGPGGRVTEHDVRAAAESGESESRRSGRPASEPDEASATADAGSGRSDGSDRSPRSGPDVERTAGDGQRAGRRRADRDRTLASPATRRVAIEEGIDIDAVPAVEEREGEAFVTEDAVREYAAEQRRAQTADAEAVSGGAADAGAAADSAESGSQRTDVAGPGRDAGTTETAGTPETARTERREPYRGVRRTIGEAMAESKYTAPHVSHHDEVDVTKLVATKERLAERAEERGIHLTYVPFVLKAVVGALQEYPILNSQLDEDAEEIVYRNYYDLGVATATDAGLMVPVVEAVDGKGMLQIASELSELVEKARDRTIAPDELRGSTFTVTNVGAIGGEYATPIINQPEVAILALGQIRRKPRVVTDEDGAESIEPRSILPLSLSFDHRVVDGAIAAQFTNAVRERLRDPELLLLE